MSAAIMFVGGGCIGFGVGAALGALAAACLFARGVVPKEPK